VGNGMRTGMGSNLQAGLGAQRTADAVVNGLWHCLWGSLATGLGVSAILGVLVLGLNLLN